MRKTALLFLSLVCLQAFSQPVATSDLAKGCGSKVAAERATCDLLLTAFIDGFVEGHASGEAHAIGVAGNACPDFTKPELEAALLVLLREHPEARDWKYSVAASMALRLYICK